MSKEIVKSRLTIIVFIVALVLSIGIPLLRISDFLGAPFQIYKVNLAELDYLAIVLNIVFWFVVAFAITAVYKKVKK